MSLKPQTHRLPAADKASAQAAVAAAAAGNMEELKKYVESGAGLGLLHDDIDHLPASSFSEHRLDAFILKAMHRESGLLNAALYVAAYHGREEVVDYFLARGAFCQATLDAGLYAAVSASSETLVDKLLAAGARLYPEESAFFACAARNGAMKLVERLAQAAGSWDRALAACVYYKHYDMALGILDHKPQTGLAVDAIASGLSDEFKQPDAEQKLLFLETLLAFAKAAGAGMNDVVAAAVESGLLHKASLFLDKLSSHEDFERHPRRREFLNRIIEATAQNSAPALHMQYEGYVPFIKKLLRKGARAQKLLEISAKTCHATLFIQAILEPGVDPRRHRLLAFAQERCRKAPENKEFLSIKQFLQQKAEQLDQEQSVVIDGFCGGREFTLEGLRRIDPESGMSGFMIAAALGRGAEAVEVFLKANAKLTQADLARLEKYDGSIVGILADRDEAGLLCNPKLFGDDPEEYLSFWNSLPAGAQEFEKERHALTLHALASRKNHASLKGKASRNGNPYKL